MTPQKADGKDWEQEALRKSKALAVFGMVFIGIVCFVLGLVAGIGCVSCDYCDYETSFYNGSCFIYGAINEMLSCSNNISVFMGEGDWNISCLNDTIIKLGKYEEITYCPWYRWEDFKP